MPEAAQQYSNHARIHPPFHRILVPVLLIHFIWSLVQLIRSPTWMNGETLLLAVGLVVLGFLARIYALKVQDRLIRLEEQLRYQRVLPAELAAQASALPVGQIVALRFASDEELPGLARQVLGGQLAGAKEIKLAVQNWRADLLRV